MLRLSFPPRKPSLPKMRLFLQARSMLGTRFGCSMMTGRGVSKVSVARWVQPSSNQSLEGFHTCQYPVTHGISASRVRLSISLSCWFEPSTMNLFRLWQNALSNVGFQWSSPNNHRGVTDHCPPLSAISNQYSEPNVLQRTTNPPPPSMSRIFTTSRQVYPWLLIIDAAWSFWNWVKTLGGGDGFLLTALPIACIAATIPQPKTPKNITNEMSVTVLTVFIYRPLTWL